MTLNDPLANMFSNIMNSERIGKNEVTIKPASKLIKNILLILNENGYIGSFEEIIDGKGNMLTIKLIGAINDCGVIKPRYATTLGNYTKHEKRYLPAKGFGILIVSTSKGLMIHEKAKENNVGGCLVAYCY